MTKTNILVLYTAGTHKESINQFYFANCAHLSAVLQKQRYSAKQNTTRGFISWKLFVCNVRPLQARLYIISCRKVLELGYVETYKSCSFNLNTQVGN